MKVILKAFQGKLISDPMEWQGAMTAQIRMPLTFDQVENMKMKEKKKLIGMFEFKRMVETSDREGAYEYILTDIVI